MAPDEPDSEWHTIRPWTRRISLQVREVTSVSVTFILRSSMGASHSETLAVLGVESDEEEDMVARMPTISDALGRGIAVKVNGSHWHKVVVHVDEDEEEAIVIVYGLGPRKKYEIGLSIVASDEAIRENITTQPGQDAMSDLPTVNVIEHVPDSATSPSTLTPPTTPIRSSPPRTITQEERAAQLRKQLALLNSEREDLMSQLKLARRESQRTETALKGEIETLRRASEKHASGEHRSRQKVLALQEAVKQAGAAAGDIEQLVEEIEKAMPELSERAEVVEAEHRRVKEEAEQRSLETETAVQVDKKMVAELEGELTGVCARLDKVTGKKEKLENEVVPQLEDRLQELRREIEEMERADQGDDLQHGDEDTQGPWSVRNWVPPIQRPLSQQRSSSSFTSNSNSGFNATTPPYSPPRQPSFRSTRAPNFKVRSNATLSPLIPSYDPNFSLRGLAPHEETPTPDTAPPPRVTSELKSGSTFHTPPRFQTQNTSYLGTPFDFVVRRPSPNPANGDREPPLRQTSLPTPNSKVEGYFEGASATRGDHRPSS